MKRLVGTLIGLAVVVLLLCVPVLFYGSGEVEANTEETTITDYVADFDVAENGDLSVTETLTVDFPYGGKHGIFRYWDTVDDNAPHARRTPEITSITRDGDDEPYDLSDADHGRQEVARIGSEDVTLQPGEHTYVISYDIDGVLADELPVRDRQRRGGHDVLLAAGPARVEPADRPVEADRPPADGARGRGAVRGRQRLLQRL